MRSRIFIIILISAILCTITACNPEAADFTSAGVKTIWLDELDITKATSGLGSPQANKSVAENPITLSGQQYERGVGVNSHSEFRIALDGKAKRFTAIVGVDDDVRSSGQQQGERRRYRRRRPSVEFVIVGDKKVIWQSGVIMPSDEPNQVDVDLTGIKELRLLATEAGNNYNDHADWAMAKIEYTGKAPRAVDVPVLEKYILTPKPGPAPRITGPRIFGVRPGNPFLFTVTATGNRPMYFGARGLPPGLEIDINTGQITGFVQQQGEYKITLIAKNSLGTAERDFRIVAGDTIALTPPMGWNSWNCWACSVTDEKVRATAKAMVDTGLANHGWTYINIDDCWMRTESGNRAEDPNLGPPVRDENGEILCNSFFPDMKAFCDYIHSLGLKAGIYIGPGPTTCQRFEASWEHELQDVQTFAKWGFDYIKYDWCGYSSVSGRDTLEDLQRPYILMREVLDQVDRDIVYSICQYGWGDVWEWGEEVGGNCWRTTGDITDTWESMAGIGFRQADLAPYAKPGHWNDPDMMVLGKVGWGPSLRDARLTADEQYTHMSLWCLLCSPLLLGCPIEQLDEFTLSLLTNDEVLEVNQDPLGQQANRIYQQDGSEIWAKQMEDGSVSVGFFNRNDYAEQDITLDFTDIGFDGKCAVRDLWRQKNLGVFDGRFTASVPVHGVVFVRIMQR